MSNGFKLYYDYLSPLSRVMIVLLDHNKVVYEKVPVALRKGENLTKEFAINVCRHNKLPVIHEPDGFRLPETIAIYHYLGRKRILDERWYPKDVKQLAKIDEFLSWNHNSLLLTTGSIFLDAWIKPFKDVSGSEHGMMNSVKDPRNFVDIDSSLHSLEHDWLGNSQYLVDDKPTFAEIVAACELMQIIGLRLFELDAIRYPNVSRWLQDTKMYFNPYFDDAHFYVYKYGEKFNGPPKMSMTSKISLILRILMKRGFFSGHLK